jgi:hypothetical protein
VEVVFRKYVAVQRTCTRVDVPVPGTAARVYVYTCGCPCTWDRCEGVMSCTSVLMLKPVRHMRHEVVH